MLKGQVKHCRGIFNIKRWGVRKWRIQKNGNIQ